MTGQAANLATGIQATAAIVPAHYASEEQVARALARLGKPATAALIGGKLPTTKAIRSGDLGEIYAAEWIDAQWRLPHADQAAAMEGPPQHGDARRRRDWNPAGRSVAARCFPDNRSHSPRMIYS